MKSTTFCWIMKSWVDMIWDRITPLENHMLIAVTEMNTREEIDLFCEVLRRLPMSEPTIYEMSSPGRGFSLPAARCARATAA
jgi:hypothetical protein